MKYGKIAFLGSGETSAAGGLLFEKLASQYAVPLRMAILESPAGFELNAATVAGRVTAYAQQRLQNFQPQVVQIPARKRGEEWGTDTLDYAAQVLQSDLIFLGPGSPTYTARILRDSLVEQALRSAHGVGASLVFGSAAAIAAGRHTLPVYEIYKVGEDPYWKPGLDLLAAFGLELAIIPHWNNNDGGAELDTSRCFMGVERFSLLEAMLPESAVVVGLDEHTACILDLAENQIEVTGRGSLHLRCEGEWCDFAPGVYGTADMRLNVTVMPEFEMPQALAGLALRTDVVEAEGPSAEAVELADQRAQARQAKDWARADELRNQLLSLGWAVKDTPDGQVLNKAG